MNITQKIVLVTTGSSGTQGVTTVNEDLRKGWRLMQITPMGGAGSGDTARFAAIVVLEREVDSEAPGPEAAEEEADIDAQIEQALEGGFMVGSGPTSPQESGWRNPDLGG